jgi:hypothetical protein
MVCVLDARRFLSATIRVSILWCLIWHGTHGRRRAGCTGSTGGRAGARWSPAQPSLEPSLSDSEQADARKSVAYGVYFALRSADLEKSNVPNFLTF